MLEKIENRLRKEGRKQRGKRIIKNRKNIIANRGNITIYVKRNMIITLNQFKIIRLDLSKIFPSSEFFFRILPNKSFSKKGILVRMGKGKGKLDFFGTRISEGALFIEIKNERGDKNPNNLNKFFKKYPFLALK